LSFFSFIFTFWIQMNVSLLGDPVYTLGDIFLFNSKSNSVCASLMSSIFNIFIFQELRYKLQKKGYVSKTTLQNYMNFIIYIYNYMLFCFLSIRLHLLLKFYLFFIFYIYLEFFFYIFIFLRITLSFFTTKIVYF